jgi:3-hexulose-6-phosphate synthase
MLIQLALDRMTIDEAIRIAQQVGEYVDWIEVGTSLIKEFGMESVRRLRAAFPDHTIVADLKTFDNARYEFELAFASGADIATVMGAAPAVTLDACMEVADRQGKRVMVDLLNTPAPRLEELFQYREAILCVHVSKDQQEMGAGKETAPRWDRMGEGREDGPDLAFAGGITAADLRKLAAWNPSVLVVGSAITKAVDPAAAARLFRQTADEWKGDIHHE